MHMKVGNGEPVYALKFIRSNLFSELKLFQS